MSDIAIKFENISKQYRLGVVGTGTISHDLNRWWHLVRGKEDPYLQVGQVNDRSSKATSDYVWALKDINFEIKQGEAIGIIGKNGAGKSTLLKILSRVTSPTTGSIRARGRIASLLEVGTGFHPELTGRENIYMNGAIMGMTKAEITRKIDEIVDFAGIEKYLDTPTKRYSSGMTVRLGFAIAAHLEPEILVVDEVLAVGDAEFQKKAIGKMQDVSKGEGRTVLFVSHNMGVISALCHSSILLNNGTIQNIGITDNIINEYMTLSKDDSSGGYSFDDEQATIGKKLKIRQVKILNSDFELSAEINNAKEGYIEIGFDVLEEGRGYNVVFELVHSHFGVIFASGLKDMNPEANDMKRFETGRYSFQIPLPMHILREGEYVIKVAAAIPKIEMLDTYRKETSFTLLDSISPIAKTTEGRTGVIIPVIPWNDVKSK